MSNLSRNASETMIPSTSNYLPENFISSAERSHRARIPCIHIKTISRVEFDAEFQNQDPVNHFIGSVGGFATRRL